MADITIQRILEQVEQLPLKEQFEVTARLQKRALELARQMSQGRLISTSAPHKDRALEEQWLRANQHLYMGQWVALEGNNLLAHGKRLSEVAAKAEAAGEPQPLFFSIEPEQSYSVFASAL